MNIRIVKPQNASELNKFKDMVPFYALKPLHHDLQENILMILKVSKNYMYVGVSEKYLYSDFISINKSKEALSREFKLICAEFIKGKMPVVEQRYFQYLNFKNQNPELFF